jgi:DNA-binding transcriptional MerR regulator
MEIYKSKDIQKRLGVSKIQLSHWINMGAIKPYKQDNRRGGSHEFNRQNIIETAICKELSDLRVPVKSMVQALKMMHEVGFEVWSTFDNDWYMVFSSVYKFDYKDIDPQLRRYFSKIDRSEVEKTFGATLIPKESLLKDIEYFQAAIVLSLKRVLDLVDGI